MKRFIQYYSILIFPILLGSIIPLVANGGIDLTTIKIAVWGICCTFNVLPKMLRISMHKNWLLRLICGLVGLILVYALAISVPLALLGISDNGIRYLIQRLPDFFGMVRLLSVIIMLPFMPYNIGVIACFLLNGVYVKRINYMLTKGD